MEVIIDKSMLAEVKAAMSDIKNGYKKVLVTSINTTLGTTKKNAASRINNEVNLKVSRIKQDMTLRKANFSKMSGALVCKGEPVGLIQFGASQVQKGVTVKVLRSSPRTLLKHAYIGTGKNSTKTHVFWRAYDGPRNYNPKWMSIRLKMFPYAALPKKYRLPLERLTGPRIEDIFAKDKVMEPVTIQANTLFLSNVDAKITEVIRRHG